MGYVDTKVADIYDSIRDDIITIENIEMELNNSGKQTDYDDYMNEFCPRQYKGMLDFYTTLPEKYDSDAQIMIDEKKAALNEELTILKQERDPEVENKIAELESRLADYASQQKPINDELYELEGKLSRDKELKTGKTVPSATYGDPLEKEVVLKMQQRIDELKLKRAPIKQKADEIQPELKRLVKSRNSDIENRIHTIENEILPTINKLKPKNWTQYVEAQVALWTTTVEQQEALQGQDLEGAKATWTAKISKIEARIDRLNASLVKLQEDVYEFDRRGYSDVRNKKQISVSVPKTVENNTDEIEAPENELTGLAYWQQDENDLFAGMNVYDEDDLFAGMEVYDSGLNTTRQVQWINDLRKIDQ